MTKIERYKWRRRYKARLAMLDKIIAGGDGAENGFGMCEWCGLALECASGDGGRFLACPYCPANYDAGCSGNELGRSRNDLEHRIWSGLPIKRAAKRHKRNLMVAIAKWEKRHGEQ